LRDALVSPQGWGVNPGLFIEIAGHWWNL
jgi:hypothetical protein